jgi:hypothetical protein
MGASKMTVISASPSPPTTWTASGPSGHRLDEEARPTERPTQARAMRRTGTWAQVIEATETPPD